MLCLNGVPHVQDATFGQFDCWLEQGFGVIAPSRCGYGRTPIDNGRTFADEAATYAALLDTLGVDKVVVHMYSGGGPSGYHFAAKYPERTIALLPLATLSGSFDRDVSPIYKSSTKFMMTSVMLAKMTRSSYEKDPADCLKEFYKFSSDYTPEEMKEQAAATVADPKLMENLKWYMHLVEIMPAQPECYETMCIASE